MAHWYLAFDDVTVDENTGTISDDTSELVVFDKFHPEIIDMSQAWPPDLNDDGEVNIADINALIDRILSGATVEPWPWGIDGRYYIEGFLTIYKGQMELYPVKIIKYGTCLYGDINGDGEVNIADINALIDYILSRN